MKIQRVTVTPIAFRDPPLLNASGIHEPYALRSIIEIESDNGNIGLGESYGDAPALAIQQQLQEQLTGLDPFNLNHLRAIVQATVAANKPRSMAGAELAPGSHASKAVSNAYSAFEVAFLDLQAQYLKVPLVDLLGGAVRDEIPFSAYLFFKYAEHIDSPYKADAWGEALNEDQLLLMRIQARRHKRPHLPEHEWQSQQKGRHQQDLERHHEGRDHRSGNQRSALGQMRYEWRCQKVVQRPGAGKEKQEGSSHGNGNDGLDQSVAQLHQMLDKRLLRSSKLVFLGGGVCHVGSSRASGPPMQRARAQHQWNFLGR